MSIITLHASSLERVLLCPGSVRAEAGLPDTTSPEAAAGKRIHAALAELALNKTINPQPADLPLYAALPDDEKKITDKLNRDLTGLGEKHLGLQKLIPEQFIESSQLSLCGTPDLLAICNDGFLLMGDYKSGWSTPIPAEKNLQLRAYAFLALTEQKGYKGYEKLLACLLTKNAEPQITKYTLSDLPWIKKELQTIIRRAQSKKAKRIKGMEQCKNCRANGNPERCMESCKVETIVPIAGPPSPAVLKALPTIYKQLKLAEKAHEAFMEWLRQLMTDHPELVPWAKFGEPNRRRIVTNAQTAFELGLELGWFNQEDFVKKCITVRIPAIEKLAGKRKRHVEEMLKDAGALEIKFDRPPIELIKERDEKLSS